MVWAVQFDGGSWGTAARRVSVRGCHKGVQGKEAEAEEIWSGPWLHTPPSLEMPQKRSMRKSSNSYSEFEFLFCRFLSRRTPPRSKLLFPGASFDHWICALVGDTKSGSVTAVCGSFP